jgi:hypothetical protein
MSLKETREMRLMTRVIQMSDVPEKTLAEFIAHRRAPGEHWRSWEGVTVDLNEITGEVVGIATLRTWATIYGIPDGTRQNGNSGITPATYAKAVRKAGITI